MYHLLAVYVILFVIVGHILIVQKLFRMIKTYMKMKRVTKISEGKTARSVTPTATDPDVEDFSYNLMKEMLDKFGGDFN